MAERPDLLIAAQSGRALAAAARRAGFAPLVLDLFGDDDTRSLSRGRYQVVGDLERGFDAEALLAGAAALAPTDAEPPVPLVAGSGFEDRLELLGRLSQGRVLLGNPPAVQARIKDPASFAALCAERGVAHPETRIEPSPEAAGWPGDWLVKQRGASGGAHVRTAGAAEQAAPGRYFQRRIAGRSLSALFLADGGRARIVGFSALRTAGHSGAPPYLFGGAVGPIRLRPDVFARLRLWLDDLVADSGLRGLNSADLIVSDRQPWLIEINPRPGATLELFDRRKGPSLLAAHIEASRGRLPSWRLETPGVRAMKVLYAEAPVSVPADLAWPDWSADRTPGGRLVPSGAPLCTLFATGANLDEAEAMLAQRSAVLSSALASQGLPEGRAGGLPNAAEPGFA